jgi:hypothetical protein
VPTVNGYGYFGKAVTKNLCSHCYKEHLMKTAAAAPIAKKKANVATMPAPAEKASQTDQKHQGSSADVVEKKVDTAPTSAAKTKDSGSSVEKTTEKHEVSPSSSSGATAAASPVMCVNGCTFFGSTATKNMCSSCYRDFLVKDAHAAPAVEEKVIEVIAPATPLEISASTSSSPSALGVKAASNRCAGAGHKKKVGLPGFVCHCGMFCPMHRHTDKHACDFDFKRAARAASRRQAGWLVTLLAKKHNQAVIVLYTAL